MEQIEAPDPAIRPVMKHRLSTSPSGGLGYVSSDDANNITDGWTREVHRRVSSPENPQEMLDRQFFGMHHSQVAQQISISSANTSTDDLIYPPLSQQSINGAELHDGNVQWQELESTDGVVVSDRMDVLIQKGKKRATIVNSEHFHDVPTQQSLPQSPRQLLALRVKHMSA